jgi:hypothetical protein
MCSFDDPTTGSRSWVAFLHCDFLSSWANVRHVIPIFYGLSGWFAGVTCINAQILDGRILRRRPFYHCLVQRWFQELHVVDVGTACDYGQRGSTLVDE